MCSTGSRHGIVLYHCYQRRDQDISCLYYLPNYRCIFRTKICREVTRENDQTVCRHRIGHCCILNFMGQMNWIPSNGTASELYGGKLILAGFLLFVYGALNNIGIGSYALTMVTVYLLGLNPVAAFPIMMGACTFSVPIGSVQFIKFDEYSRKITLFTSTFGVLGVLVAVFLVKSLDTYILKWIVILVLLYSAYTMLSSQLKSYSN